MKRVEDELSVRGCGIHIVCTDLAKIDEVRRHVLDWLHQLKIDQYVESAAGQTGSNPMIEFRLQPDFANQLAPECDTTQICQNLNLDTHKNSCDLEREILLAMLVGPIPFEFPSFEEVESCVRMRKAIVEAARKTALAFATAAAERPADYWIYDEDQGYLVLPGKSLIEALRKATQPDVSGTLYSFSCSRATEHVIALALSEEAAARNPDLYQKLQKQAETRAIKSFEFNRVFCREYGTWSRPLPIRYFVPGDRTWFCNPDLYSSDAPGYEGSWVFYLGDCRFTNFWKRGKEFTLHDKYLEIFHWRHSTFRDAEGELRIDESIVESNVQATQQDAAKVQEIVARMERIYDPDRKSETAGCTDISRQYPRLVCPRTSEIVLPDVA